MFFQKVLEQLGRKLNYDAVVNYAGNSFCSQSWEMIEKANPMNVERSSADTAMQGLAALFGGAHVE